MAALWVGLSAQAAPQVEAEPSRVVLGASASQVRILVRGTGGPLQGVASAGTLIADGVENGATRFLWTPPEPRAPFVAVLAFWEAGFLGLNDVSTLTLPCSARTELAIDTEPGARVTVEISGAHFGPRRADARGKLRMPVEVPPSAHEARITAEVGDQGKVRVVPLAVAPSPWVWALEPQTLTKGSAGHALLIAPEAFGSQVVAQASGGQLERQETASDRVFYRLGAGPTAHRIALEAALEGETTARASATVEVQVAHQPFGAPAPQAEPTGRQFEVGAALGFFFGGGHNVGPALVANVGVAPWRIPLFLELELGVRAAWFSSAVAGLGAVSSTLVVFPIDLAVRGPVWSSGPWRLQLGAGGGLLLGTNWVSSDFGQGSSAAVTGWELFGAAQLSYRTAAVLPYLELRGAYAVVTGTGLTANPAGLVVLVGFHWLGGLR